MQRSLAGICGAVLKGRMRVGEVMFAKKVSVTTLRDEKQRALNRLNREKIKYNVSLVSTLTNFGNHLAKKLTGNQGVNR